MTPVMPELVVISLIVCGTPGEYGRVYDQFSQFVSRYDASLCRFSRSIHQTTNHLNRKFFSGSHLYPYLGIQNPQTPYFSPRCRFSSKILRSLNNLLISNRLQLETKYVHRLTACTKSGRGIERRRRFRSGNSSPNFTPYH